MGDVCELDADGYLTLTGRTSDFILRGGKNISAGLARIIANCVLTQHSTVAWRRAMAAQVAAGSNRSILTAVAPR